MTAGYLRPGAAAAEIKDGTLEAFAVMGGVPVPSIRDRAADMPMRLIPIDIDVLATLGQRSSANRRAVIPAGSYPGIDVDTPSMGVNAVWIVSADACDDLIYSITKAWWNEVSQRLSEAHNAIGKLVRFRNALERIPVPFQAGAR